MRVLRDVDRAEVSRCALWVDALGELAGVDRSGLWYRQPDPHLSDVCGGHVLSLPVGVVGVGEAWTAPGWRAARPTDQADPGAVIGSPTVPDPTPGSAAGAGAVAGLAAVLPAGDLTP